MNFPVSLAEKYPVTAIHAILTVGVSFVSIVTPLPLLFQPFVANPAVLLYAIVPSTYASANIESALNDKDCINRTKDERAVSRDNTMPGSYVDEPAESTRLRIVNRMSTSTYARIYTLTLVLSALHSYTATRPRVQPITSTRSSRRCLALVQPADIVHGFIVVDTSLRLVSALIDETPIRIGALRVHPLLFATGYAVLCGCFVPMSVIGVGVVWVFGVERRRGGSAIEYLGTCCLECYALVVKIVKKLKLRAEGSIDRTSWSDVLVEPLLKMFPVFD